MFRRLLPWVLWASPGCLDPGASVSPESRIGATRTPLEAPEAAQDAFREGEEAFRQRRYEDALSRFQEAAERAAGARPEGAAAGAVEVEALAMVARAHSLRADLAAGAPWLERAEALADPGEPLGWSRVRLVRGIYQRELGAVEQARATFEDLYHYCHDQGLPLRAVDAAHHLALVATPSMQVEWARRGLAEAEALGDERWQAVLWNNLGYTYERLGDPPAALDAYRRARVLHRRTGGAREGLVADWAVGHALRLNGEHQEAVRTLVEVLRRAEAWVGDDVHAGRDPEEALQWVGWTCEELAEVARERGDLGAARAFLERALVARRDPAAVAGLEPLPEVP